MSQTHSQAEPADAAIPQSEPSAELFREFLYTEPPKDCVLLLAHATTLDALPIPGLLKSTNLAELLGQLSEDSMEARCVLQRQVANKSSKPYRYVRSHLPRPYMEEYPLSRELHNLADTLNPADSPMEFLALHILAYKNIQCAAEKPAHAENALRSVDEWSFLLRGRAHGHYEVLREWLQLQGATSSDFLATGIE